MKIGTITVQNGMNYGASLQAFALIKYLELQGIEAHLIDYRNKKIEDRLREKTETSINMFSISEIKRVIRRILSDIVFHTNAYNQKKRKAFDDFHKGIFDKDAGTLYDLSDLKKLNRYYDGFICGSDQIWNKKITDLDDAFFLKFADKSKLKIAYAPSLGGKTDTISQTEVNIYEEKLKSLDYLSVREENNREFIETVSHQPCTVVVDPVLLLGQDEWEAIIRSVDPLLDSNYAVYYPVISDPKLEKFAMQITKERGLKLINPRLVPSYAKAKGYTGISNRVVGPLEFIRLIRDAECVFTNSFHATVFSSLFDKELYFLLLEGEHASRNNRILEYLKIINKYTDETIHNNMIHIESFSQEELHNYLDQRIKSSNDYLADALNL